MKPYYERGGIQIFLGDCREILPTLEAGSVDLVLTDPPYGAGLSVDYAERFSTKAGNWWKNTDRSKQVRHEPIVGDDQPFDPDLLLQFGKAILWGANWYASRLPNSGGWLVWDKRLGVEDANWPMSDGELAWTNIGKGLRIFRHRWFGLLRSSEHGQHYHPHQKPVALMKWCIDHAKLSPSSLVLDPYMGSGPCARAAKDFGHRYIGIEIKELYCEIAVKRLAQEVMPL